LVRINCGERDGLFGNAGAGVFQVESVRAGAMAIDEAEGVQAGLQADCARGFGVHVSEVVVNDGGVVQAEESTGIGVEIEGVIAIGRDADVARIGDGVVGVAGADGKVEAGNAVTNATPVAMIDDRSRIIIDFWVPERCWYYFSERRRSCGINP